MTRRKSYLAAGLTAGLLGVAGCQPKYLCDEFASDESCRPLVLRCGLDATNPSPRIDLAQPFSLYAQDLRAQVLKDHAATLMPAVQLGTEQVTGLMASVELDYLDSADMPRTAALAVDALVPGSDNELRVALTASAKQTLMPRRGGAALIQVTLGRWTGALAQELKAGGCSFVIAPRFSVTAGKFPAAKQGLSQLSAQLFTGLRTGCTGPRTASCQKSSALYVSYTDFDPAVPRRLLDRFVLDPDTVTLIEDTALRDAFHLISAIDRPPAASIVATASQLILRSSATKLTAMPAASASPTVELLPAPLPQHDAVQGVYDAERFFLANGTLVSAFDLPAGTAKAAARSQLTLPLTPPFRFFSRAQRPWLGAASPDALALSDLREVVLLCFDDPAGCPFGLKDSAQTQLATTLFTDLGASAMDLDPLLADLDSDGLLDLVVLNRKTKKLSWLPQLRSGSFADPQLLAGVPDAERFAVADMDGDGLLDLAILAANATPGSADLFVLLNQALQPGSVP